MYCLEIIFYTYTLNGCQDIIILHVLEKLWYFQYVFSIRKVGYIWRATV